MKLNSKYFDSIRVKPEEDLSLKKDIPLCEWPGCRKPGEHPAPKGRNREGEYYRFCIDHVKAYNKSYNYFSGMSDEQFSEFQKSSFTGHRPTWTVGVNSTGPLSGQSQTDQKRASFTTKGAKEKVYNHNFGAEDAFGFFQARKAAREQEEQKAEARSKAVKPLERKHLRTLHLEDHATAKDIKARFKDLVKKFHPDLNGGDRSSEDRLREIIQAYNFLKQAGLC